VLLFDVGRGELQSQLDLAVDDLRQKVNAVYDVERNSVRAAMLEERARYCLFISAIKPLIVRSLSCDTYNHRQPVDTQDKTMNTRS